ncbi:hypothetical protein GCM10011521_04120 [Arenimonas soli]|uniref:Uncharacterized protein n=1 Tax=Arenimonas soli TaxID=2269504 RepID=A0ABQ1HCC3_9GAMM|nr:hypothetical protein [Arenimonas soli]GGA69086.1 hypothetical protein GCM10011521_04120 [Arenimonas soli]
MSAPKGGGEFPRVLSTWDAISVIEMLAGFSRSRIDAIERELLATRCDRARLARAIRALRVAIDGLETVRDAYENSLES